jgi:DNA replication and repair protein RecF
MGFSRVRFFQFRNLLDQEIVLDEVKEVFLVGENGQGKTNFLEALYFLCYGASFRTKNERNLVAREHQEASLFGDFKRGTDVQRVGVKLTKTEKLLEWNGQAVNDRKEMVRAFPCVAFTHEDYQFIKGTPEHQRFFFDQALSMYDVSYIDSLRQYKKILRIRNFLLNSSEDSVALGIWEEKLVQTGLQLMTEREKIVKEFNEIFPKIFSKVSGIDSECLITYSPSWKEQNASTIVLELEAQRNQERERGFTLSGPHRDRFVFKSQGKDFSQFASTGQIRLLSLLLRVAQARFAEAKTGKKPVLLLDDVLLELDKEKRGRFLQELPSAEQIFFTFLPEENLGSYQAENPLRLTVVQGRFFKDGK